MPGVFAPNCHVARKDVHETFSDSECTFPASDFSPSSGRMMTKKGLLRSLPLMTRSFSCGWRYQTPPYCSPSCNREIVANFQLQAPGKQAERIDPYVCGFFSKRSPNICLHAPSFAKIVANSTLHLWVKFAGHWTLSSNRAWVICFTNSEKRKTEELQN